MIKTDSSKQLMSSHLTFAILVACISRSNSIEQDWSQRIQRAAKLQLMQALNNLGPANWDPKGIDLFDLSPGPNPSKQYPRPRPDYHKLASGMGHADSYKAIYCNFETQVLLIMMVFETIEYQTCTQMR